MNGENYSDIQPTRNDSPATPPPILPPEEEGADDGPRYEGPRNDGPRHDTPQYDGPRYDGPRFDAPRAQSAGQERYRPPNYVRWIGGCLLAVVLILLLCGGGTAVVVAMTLNSAPVTATVDKTFSVSGIPTLIIHGQLGRVHVNAGDNEKVSLHATKRVRTFTRAQAQTELDAITISTNQTGNVVTIEVDNTFGGGLRVFNTQEIDLNVTTPASTNLTVVENAGSLNATGLTGKLTTQVNAGSVIMDNMTMADGSSLRTNAGSLTLDGALQPGASLTVNVNAGSADLTLPRDTSAHLAASASAGSVNVNGWNIAQSHIGADTAEYGDLNPNPTGTITIHVSAGSATLNAA